MTTPEIDAVIDAWFKRTHKLRIKVEREGNEKAFFLWEEMLKRVASLIKTKRCI
jgi:hypothetical protein